MLQKRKITGIIILSAVAFVGIAVLVCVLYLHSKALVVEFYENAEVGVNEAADNHQFVKQLENGEILTEKAPIDTRTLGEQTVVLRIKPTFGKAQEFRFSVFVVDKEAPKISFSEHLKTDLGKEIDLLRDVRVTDNSGEEITAAVEGDYDINQIGEYRLRYVAADSSGNKAEAGFVLSVEDHESPQITFTDYLEITAGEAIDLLHGVSATDNSGEEITVSIEGEYDLSKAGEYPLSYVAKDSSGNIRIEKFTLKVKEKVIVPQPKPDPVPVPKPPVQVQGESPKPAPTTFTTAKGFHGEVRDGVTYIDGYLIANKTYSLPEGYGNGLTSETQAAFNQMAAAARADGLNLYIVSGFRSYSYQKNLYNNYAARDGVAAADTYSARAGHSEHQSGLAFDLNSVSDGFAGTPEGIWLANNCYKFGFILRYPKGKTNETGYIYEPWHFRYIGVDLATKLYNGGNWITMEDYFGITSVYQ